MDKANEIVAKLVQEMRKGTLVLCVLSQVKTPQYGYSLVQLLSDQGIAVEQNTLYPLLRRLEKQGLLESSWNVEESRPRKYYGISPLGREVYVLLHKEWKTISQAMGALLDGEGSA